MATSTRSSSRSQNQNNYSYPSAYPNSTTGSTANTRSSSTESHSRSQPLTLPPRTEKQPSFSTSALAIPIPPISPPPSAHSASSDHETLYLRHSRLINRLRFALSAPLLVVAVAVLTCQGLALKLYNDTHLPASFNLPLWPEDIDMKPVILTLVAGGLVVASCLVYLVVAVIPSPRPRTVLRSTTFALSTTLSLLSSVAALTITTYYTYHTPDPTRLNATTAHTIQSWTCFLHNSAARFNKDLALLQVPVDVSTTSHTIAAPSGFGRTCHESQAAWGLLIALLVLSVFGMGLVVVSWWVEKAIGRERKRAVGEHGLGERRAGEKGSGFVSRMSW